MLPFHLVFLFIFTGWIVNSRDSELSFSFSQMVRESVVGSEMLATDTEVYSEFGDVTSMAGAMQFMRGPLLEALYGAQESRAVGAFDQGWGQLAG